MCIAAPARVVEIDGATAVVQVADRRRRASLVMTPDAQLGEWVLVAAGNVVRRIDSAEAGDLSRALAAATASFDLAVARPPHDKPAHPGVDQARQGDST